jgi:hypothetical protein
MPGKNLLQEAAEAITEERIEAYGHPRVNLEDIARIWSVVLRADVTAEQVALCMVGTKVARLLNGYHRDSAVDIAGYARVLELLHEDGRAFLWVEDEPEDEPVGACGVAGCGCGYDPGEDDEEPVDVAERIAPWATAEERVTPRDETRPSWFTCDEGGCERRALYPWFRCGEHLDAWTRAEDERRRRL